MEKYRANKQIWRLAEWLNNTITPNNCSFNIASQYHKDKLYDKAAELLKKINNNEFTGGDDHE